MKSRNLQPSLVGAAFTALLFVFCSAMAGCSTEGCPKGTVSFGGRCVPTSSLACDDASDCPSLPNATASCERYACRFTCAPSFSDCNGDMNEPESDGCEADLRSALHCSECGSECGAMAFCAEGAGCRNFVLEDASATPLEPKPLRAPSFAFDDQGEVYASWPFDPPDAWVTYVRVARFGSGGGMAWGATITTQQQVFLGAIHADADRVWMGGLFSGETAFPRDAGAVTLMSSGYDAILFSLGKEDGQTGETLQYGGPGTQRIDRVSLDENGNAYLVGSYVETIDFGAGALSPASGEEGETAFVVSLDSARQARWSRRFDRLQFTPQAFGLHPRWVVVAGIVTEPFRENGTTIEPGVGFAVVGFDRETGQTEFVHHVGRHVKYILLDVRVHRERIYVSGALNGRPWMAAVELETGKLAFEHVQLGALGTYHQLEAAQDKLYVAGRFAGLLEETNGRSFSGLRGEGFVARVDPREGRIVYAVQLDGTTDVPTMDVAGKRIAAVGRFRGAVDFGTGPIGRNQPDAEDMYVFRFSEP